MQTPPTRVPSAVRWHIRLVAFTPFTLLALVAVYASVGWLPYRYMLFVLLLAGFSALLLLREVVRRSALRTCRKAINGGKDEVASSGLCLYCGFELHQLNAKGQCPECGTWYSAADVRRVWLDCERWLREKRFRM